MLKLGNRVRYSDEVLSRNCFPADFGCLCGTVVLISRDLVRVRLDDGTFTGSLSSVFERVD